MNNKKTKNIKTTMTQKSNNKPVTLSWFKYLTYSLLVCLIILTIIIRTNFSDIPFERDEGDYFYIAQMVLDGKTPYIDFYEMKLPGLFYSYALILKIFGNTIEGAHFGFMIINIITLILIFFIGKKVYNELSGLVASGFFLFLSLNPHMMGFTTQSEHFIALFVSAGILSFIAALKQNKRWFYLIAGAFFAAAVFVKQTSAIFPLIAGLSIIYYNIKRKQKIKNLLFDLLLLIAGFSFISFLMLLPVFLNNATDEMIYWTVKFANNYIGEISTEQGLDLFKTTFSNIFRHYGVFWIISFAGIMLLFAIKEFKGYKIFLFVMILFSFGVVVPGLRFYGHYFLQLTPVLSILAATAFYAFYKIYQKYVSKKSADIIFLLLFLIVCVSHLNSNNKYYFRPNHTKVLRDVYGMNPFPEAKVIGDFIKENTNPDDKIAVLGSEPEIYFYSDRRCVSRHHYITFLMGDTLLFPENKNYQKEYVNDIETNKPKYMVFFNHPISWLTHPNASPIINNWFNDYSMKYYNLVGVIDMISPVQTNYVWYDKIPTYKPSGKYLIGVFERKEDK